MRTQVLPLRLFYHRIEIKKERKLNLVDFSGFLYQNGQTIVITVASKLSACRIKWFLKYDSVFSV